MSDNMSTATHRIIKPRALAMRTILGAFSFPVWSCSEVLAYVVIAWAAHCCRPSPRYKVALVSSYNRVKWTAGGGRLHGEDAAAGPALISLPAQPP